MQRWRKVRDGNTGIATNGRRPRDAAVRNAPIDSSEASNSSYFIMRQKISSTGHDEIIELDAFRFDDAVFERPHPVVVFAGQSEMEHSSFLAF